MPLNEAVLEVIRRQTVAAEAVHAKRLVTAYRRAYNRLLPQAQMMAERVAVMRARGEVVGKARIWRMTHYKQLLADTRAEMERYAAIIGDEVEAGQMELAELGVDQAERLVALTFSDWPADARAQIMGTFGRLPAEAVEAMVTALREDYPLWTRTLSRYGEEHAKGIGDALTANLLAGKSPRVTAREMRKAFGVPLTDALRISRTEQIRAHRLASLAQYRANPHVVKDWIWASALIPGRTCMSCVALHGTRHPLSETMDDHPAGLCHMAPETVSMQELGLDLPEARPDIQPGEDWFGAQPEGVQRSMMGEKKYEAWKAGQFQFSQLTAERQDPEWGRTLGEASLKSILGVAA